MCECNVPRTLEKGNTGCFAHDFYQYIFQVFQHVFYSWLETPNHLKDKNDGPLCHCRSWPVPLTHDICHRHCRSSLVIQPETTRNGRGAQWCSIKFYKFHNCHILPSAYDPPAPNHHALGRKPFRHRRATPSHPIIPVIPSSHVQGHSVGPLHLLQGQIHPASNWRQEMMKI